MTTTPKDRGELLTLIGDAIWADQYLDRLPAGDSDPKWLSILGHADAALAAIEAAGCAVVPVEATPEMRARGADQAYVAKARAQSTWHAMLSASPFREPRDG